MALVTAQDHVMELPLYVVGLEDRGNRLRDDIRSKVPEWFYLPPSDKSAWLPAVEFLVLLWWN